MFPYHKFNLEKTIFLHYSKFLIIRLLGLRKKEDELSRKMRYQEKVDRSTLEITLVKFIKVGKFLGYNSENW